MSQVRRGRHRTSDRARDRRGTQARRDADAVAGGISAGRTRRLRLQPMARALPRVGGSAVADDASGASGRRADVRHYAGQTVELIDGRSGEIRQAQIFGAVLGASAPPAPGGDDDSRPRDGGCAFPSAGRPPNSRADRGLPTQATAQARRPRWDGSVIAFPRMPLVLQKSAL